MKYHLHILAINEYIKVINLNKQQRIFDYYYKCDFKKHLSQSQERVLNVIEKMNWLTQKEIGRKMTISQPTLSRILDELIKKSIIVSKYKNKTLVYKINEKKKITERNRVQSPS